MCKCKRCFCLFVLFFTKFLALASDTLGNLYGDHSNILVKISRCTRCSDCVSANHLVCLYQVTAEFAGNFTSDLICRDWCIKLPGMSPTFVVCHWLYFLVISRTISMAVGLFLSLKTIIILFYSHLTILS